MKHNYPPSGDEPIKNRKKAVSETTEATVVLVGNPNVGKSTLFNNLTGMDQHTGNWPGKTVATAEGSFVYEGHRYLLLDLPGTYSLFAHSPEEEVARDIICLGKDGAPPDAAVIVCDATCLERNLALVLQTLEISRRAIVCVNLIDEAEKKGIHIDSKKLSDLLGVNVIKTTARSKRDIPNICRAIVGTLAARMWDIPTPVTYHNEIEKAVAIIEAALTSPRGETRTTVNKRWIALRMLDGCMDLADLPAFGIDVSEKTKRAYDDARQLLSRAGYDRRALADDIALTVVERAADIYRSVVGCAESTSELSTVSGYSKRDRAIDRIVTSRATAYPIMLLMLAGIFWLTIVGANYPSELLSAAFGHIEKWIYKLLIFSGLPTWFCDAAVLGMLRVLGWVVAVMLPPMAIFFPLFTLLEDSGLLPRIAYNLDRPFCRCKACGKQALTMCMGFGCNAAGVVGCRIIDSPRERLLAVVTNSLVPCNGRFPSIILALTAFLALGSGASSLSTAALLTLVILLGIGATLFSTYLLSRTLLRGEPSAFTLELPPYRRPQLGKVMVRSLLDRTLFVLGRSVAVAAPAGLIIWLLANIDLGGASILTHLATAIDPIGRIMGLDGAVLLGFMLGSPANEIVLPITLMIYLASGSLSAISGTEAIKAILLSNGWGARTAICFVIFSLLHWPCTTTLLTIKKETGSIKWTLLAALLPTMLGVLATVIINALWMLLTK